MSDFDEANSMGMVAIIGMAGRFPGAQTMEEFWWNLVHGVESVKFFSREDLIKMGIDEHLLDNPKFVAADAILDGMDLFDASFFDYSAREAEIMDPQHRLFLESAWEALENAGYNSELYQGRIAVYASANLSSYMIRNLYSNPGLVDSVGSFKIMLANGQDFLATKVSYKMNLMGPSVNVNTLCSSSLVAVHYACQNLLNYGCDLALAGGVSFQVSRNESFFYQEGGIGSSDGHCRAYDAKANGTVSGSGLGIVVLKRLEEAIADGDHIYAVIRGTGINNDGSSKNSYTAPNVDGQAECIAEAIAMSGINPETISYIDGHGTGTDLGDPIEIAALTKAFRAYTQKKQFCAIGSVKTNIGHLVNAGGLASLIKTVLAMNHKMIPPSLNFTEPNPKIDFINSPFYVNTKLSKWESNGSPRRAGVSSFGIGGTNTHVILEEAPEPQASAISKRPYQLICFSAKTATALEKITANLLDFADHNPQLNLADMAFTLHLGRRNFNYRRCLICRDLKDLKEQLELLSPDRVFTYFQKPKEQPVGFMFPGEGVTVNFGSDLYNSESYFRKIVDDCANIIQSLLGVDLRPILYPAADDTDSAIKLKKEPIANAVLFTLEYALAMLLMEWGIRPSYLIGEGNGEYVAACLGGALSLEDALKLTIAADDALLQLVTELKIGAIKIPIRSSVTGNWLTDSELNHTDYWIKQRGACCFEKGLQGILEDADQILLELGQGERLTRIAKRYCQSDSKPVILPALPEVDGDRSDSAKLLSCLGKFWLAGGKVAWDRFYAAEKRRRIPLPTYPFERQRYWIEPGKRDVKQPDLFLTSKAEITDDLLKQDFKEARLSLTLSLDDRARTMDERKQQLEELLALKERLAEICREYQGVCPRIEVSALGLKTQGVTDHASLNHSGKLKKRPRPELETPYVPPRNEVERIIIDKWEEVLGFDQIGIHDDFFQLGGHSLIAAAVATELSKKLNVQIPLRTLFETTTAAEIAELIQAYLWVGKGNQESAADGELEGGTI